MVGKGGLLLLLLPAALASLPPLDSGLQWQFVTVELASGSVHTGQVIGVYNEAKFMWSPTKHSTIALFVCESLNVTLGDFG
jgi:hypothetical protein